MFITFICQFSYQSSPSLLFINSSIFLHLKFSLIFPRIQNMWLPTLPLGCWAFSLVLTFSLMARLRWWSKSSRLAAPSAPRPVQYPAPPLNVGPSIPPSIQHGPEPCESTCLLPNPQHQLHRTSTSPESCPKGQPQSWDAFTFKPCIALMILFVFFKLIS